MRTSTGLALIAIGSVLLLAVHIQLPFIRLGVAGLVITATGLVWLRVPQLTFGWLVRNKDAIRQVLGQVPDPGDRNRVPLDALLGVARSGMGREDARAG